MGTAYLHAACERKKRRVRDNNGVEHLCTVAGVIGRMSAHGDTKLHLTRRRLTMTTV